MSNEYVIWRHRQGLVMHADQEEEAQNHDYAAVSREVRYAVPCEITDDLCYTKPDPLYEVPIMCVRNVQSDVQDLPRPQWADGGTFPAGAFLELYEPVS